MIHNYGSKVRLKFHGICLKQSNKLTCSYGSWVSIYIVYEPVASGSNDSDPTLKSCLFGAVTLTKNADIEKYGYSCYGIGFDKRSIFSFLGGRFGQNILIFGVDMSCSAHIDNKNKKHISSWKGTNTKSRTYGNCRKKCIPLILLSRRKDFVWACITMEQIVTYLMMVQKFINLKQKILKL